jgi:peptide chain release factor 2
LWDDQTKAQEILQELNDLKAHLQQYHQWKASLEDTRAVLDLLELETDEGLLQEAESTVTKLNRELDQWELLQLLSGPYDEKGAVLTINAGAGGTDAQDWAEMLLRMYTRWGENHGYKVQLNELSEGDEAGIKSVTVEITGTLCLRLPAFRNRYASPSADFTLQCQRQAANQLCWRGSDAPDR